MRKLLNTLYITNPNAYLSKDGENIVVKINDEEIGRRPIHILEGVVCFNFNGMSPALMKLCGQHGVTVSFLSQYGNFLGRVQGEINGNVLLRRTQYRIADDNEKSLDISRNFIIGKVVNGRKVINRALRDHSNVVNDDLLLGIQEKMSNSIDKIKNCFSSDELRGIEGEVSRAYFQGINELILHQKKAFFFKEISRRPPLDNLNALLSYAYTLITYEMSSALETVGLDPYVGFFHTDRPGRVSLALDMIEELRSYMADRFVLSLINRRQINEDGFVPKENGGILMKDETKKAFLSSWQKRKQDIIEHPFIHERIEFGLIPYVQACLMARYIRGDIEAYPPFFVS